MALGYEFVTLDDDQKASRRYLLGLYGAIAQWSALLVLAVFQFCFFLSWMSEEEIEKNGPRSPSFNKRSDERFTSLRKARSAVQKWRWWMNKPILSGNWGTRGEWLVGGLWTTWLLFLSINQTGNDYLHLTKRFGIVGAAQLPLHYLLAMRSPKAPLQLLTRLSHEQLKAYHQVLGRIIYFLLVLHASFYLNFFVRSGFLAKRIRDTDVIIGLISISLFTIINTTALGYVRRWNYRVFYITHIFVAGAVITPLFFHVKHIRPYIVEVFAILLINQIFRNAGLRRYSGTIKQLPGTSLVQIRIPLTAMNKELQWKPGQHVYLSKPSGHAPSFSGNDQFILRNHINPFTVASIPAVDKELLLIARTLNGHTKHLAHLAKSLSAHAGTDEIPSIPIALEGPYGASIRLPDFSTFERVLLVAGGVGATFIMPIYRSIIHTNSTNRSSLPHVQFIWSVRKLAETQWAFSASETDGDELEAPSHNSAAEVYITRPSGADLQTNDDGDDIELAEDNQLLSIEEKMEKPRKGVVLKTGRPSIPAIVNQTFDKCSGRVAVIVCGPRGLTEQLRGSVERWVNAGHDVYWHEEGFGW